MSIMEKNIKKMIKDLEEHKHNKDELLEHYVKTRLNKSVQSYYSDILDSVEGISTINTNRVIRKLERSLTDK